MRVSTLSMCDLAGSERTNRTKADGDRLKEAGIIKWFLVELMLCVVSLLSQVGESKLFRVCSGAHLNLSVET